MKELVLESLVLNAEDLNRAGLHSKALFIIGYDLPSKKKVNKKKSLINGKKATAQEVEATLKLNVVVEHYRNRMKYLLKWVLMATKHLESSWLLTAERINDAIEALTNMKEEMRPTFKDIDRRIRIIPVWTTEKGYETFEELKAQFLMDFATQHIAACDRGLDSRKMDSSKLWRCKKAYEYVHILADELEDQSLKHEVKDTVGILSDKIAQVESMLVDIEQEEEEKQKQ